LRKVRVEDEFTLRYTDSAEAQLKALSFEVLSGVERELERICQQEDPMRLGHAEEDIPDRRRYEITPVHVIAWVTSIEPDTRLLTVVEILFPDETATNSSPAPSSDVPPRPESPPSAPAQEPEAGTEPKRKPRRILYPRRHMPVPAEV
jgi:hypothetical protein